MTVLSGPLGFSLRRLQDSNWAVSCKSKRDLIVARLALRSKYGLNNSWSLLPRTFHRGPSHHVTIDGDGAHISSDLADVGQIIPSRIYSS